MPADKVLDLRRQISAVEKEYFLLRLAEKGKVHTEQFSIDTLLQQGIELVSNTVFVELADAVESTHFMRQTQKRLIHSAAEMENIRSKQDELLERREELYQEYLAESARVREHLRKVTLQAANKYAADISDLAQRDAATRASFANLPDQLPLPEDIKAEMDAARFSNLEARVAALDNIDMSERKLPIPKAMEEVQVFAEGFFHPYIALEEPVNVAPDAVLPRKTIYSQDSDEVAEAQVTLSELPAESVGVAKPTERTTKKSDLDLLTNFYREESEHMHKLMADVLASEVADEALQKAEQERALAIEPQDLVAELRKIQHANPSPAQETILQNRVNDAVERLAQIMNEYDEALRFSIAMLKQGQAHYENKRNNLGVQTRELNAKEAASAQQKAENQQKLAGFHDQLVSVVEKEKQLYMRLRINTGKSLNKQLLLADGTPGDLLDQLADVIEEYVMLKIAERSKGDIEKIRNACRQFLFSYIYRDAAEPLAFDLRSELNRAGLGKAQINKIMTYLELMPQAKTKQEFYVLAESKKIFTTKIKTKTSLRAVFQRHMGKCSGTQTARSAIVEELTDIFNKEAKSTPEQQYAAPFIAVVKAYYVENGGDLNQFGKLHALLHSFDWDINANFSKQLQTLTQFLTQVDFGESVIGTGKTKINKIHKFLTCAFLAKNPPRGEKPQTFLQLAEKHEIFESIYDGLLSNTLRCTYDTCIALVTDIKRSDADRKAQLAVIGKKEVLSHVAALDQMVEAGKANPVALYDQLAKFDYATKMYAPTSLKNRIRQGVKRNFAVKVQSLQAVQQAVVQAPVMAPSVVKAVQEKAEIDKNLALIKQKIADKQKVLANLEPYLLNMMKFTACVAMQRYKTEATGIFHTQTGMENAQNFFKEVIAARSWKAAVAIVSDFLKKDHKLRDASFTTILLQELYNDATGGLLSGANRTSFDNLVEKFNRAALPVIKKMDGMQRGLKEEGVQDYLGDISQLSMHVAWRDVKSEELDNVMRDRKAKLHTQNNSAEANALKSTDCIFSNWLYFFGAGKKQERMEIKDQTAVELGNLSAVVAPGSH